MNLSKFRTEKGLQQKDLMKDVGLYSKIENGKVIAIEEDCERFAEVFNCELPDLFEEKELIFFERVLKPCKDNFDLSKEFAENRPKLSFTLICKSVKRHIELIRKCYRLNRSRNEKLKRIIAAEGFKTEQEWYNFIVDREIEKRGL